MLQSTILGSKIIKNTEKEDFGMPSLLEALRRHYPILADQSKQQRKNDIHDDVVVSQQSGRAEYVSVETNIGQNSDDIEKARMSDSGCNNETICAHILGGRRIERSPGLRYLESAENQLQHMLWLSHYKETFY